MKLVRSHYIYIYVYTHINNALKKFINQISFDEIQ